MNAKEYLSQITAFEKKLQEKKLNLEAIKQISCDISSPRINNETHSSSSSKQCKLELYVNRIITLEDTIREDECILDGMRNKALELIDKVDNFTSQNILIMRYLNHMSWNDIADVLSFSNCQVYRLYAKAINEMDEVMKHVTSCQSMSLDDDYNRSII